MTGCDYDRQCLAMLNRRPQRKHGLEMVFVYLNRQLTKNRNPGYLLLYCNRQILFAAIFFSYKNGFEYFPEEAAYAVKKGHK